MYPNFPNINKPPGKIKEFVFRKKTFSKDLPHPGLRLEILAAAADPQPLVFHEKCDFQNL
jgi:hypothetical protein